jgi:hypothetical protein
MKKYLFITCCQLVLIICLCIGCNQKKQTNTVTIKKLENYPSASAIEYYNGHLYIMGDDAPDMMVLDTNFAFVRTVPVVSYSGKRIPREIKHDLEASAFFNSNQSPALLFIGSCSSPSRFRGLQYNPEEMDTSFFSLQTICNTITAAGISQVNIEGAAMINDELILLNRGNKSYPYNHLIITGFNRDSNTTVNNRFVIIPVSMSPATATFSGASGLCYSAKTDQAIMSVSTEDTHSNLEDGTIGKSYLWVFNAMEKKLNEKVISPDRIIDLEDINPLFKGHKIESITIINETSSEYHLVLVADNDDGSSTLFRLNIDKKEN